MDRQEVRWDLDLDEAGPEALKAVLDRQDLPKPNYVLNTSPSKYHVVWKAEGFTKDQAEDLQRGLARETGADSAATDCARVLRVLRRQRERREDPDLDRSVRLCPRRHRPRPPGRGHPCRPEQRRSPTARGPPRYRPPQPVRARLGLRQASPRPRRTAEPDRRRYREVPPGQAQPALLRRAYRRQGRRGPSH